MRTRRMLAGRLLPENNSNLPWRIPGAWFTKVSRILNRLRILNASGEQIGHMEMDLLGMRTYLLLTGGVSGTLTGCSWAMGTINQSTRKVTIGTGIIFRGTLPAIIVPAAEVTITGGTLGAPSYVWLRGLWNGTGFAIQPTTVTTVPHPSTSYYDIPLHSFYFTDGSLVHLRQHRFEDIDLLGEHAP